MKSNIIKVAFCALFAFCSLSASADIKSLFQKGEHVTIGDSIKGKMLRFTTDGILHSDSPDAPVLPTECRIVMQDSTFFEHRRPGDGAHQHLYGLPALLLYQREAHEKAGNHYLHQPGPEPDAGRIYGTGHLPDHEPVQGPAPSGRGSQASAARLWETRLTKWRILL